MNREPLKIIGDILINFMELDEEQIFIYNQDFNLPEISGLFIVLDRGLAKTFSTTNQFIPAVEGVSTAQQNITSLRKENYIINIMSKNDEARLREYEVDLALKSNFSENQQGIYQFKIATINDGNSNVSNLEGAGMYTRFAIDISLFAHYSKTIEAPFYDDFTNQTIID